jgi:hypothetical protein
VTVATKSILDIAKTAVPEHVRATGKLVAHEDSVAGHPMTRARGAMRAQPVSTDAIADQLAARLGVKPKAKRSAAPGGQSGDVEFTEMTPLGKRSIVVQVRGGKVKQVIKRA